MTTKDTGGPAFPSEHRFDDETSFKHEGMTLRDYFAAKAMSLGWKVFDEGYSPRQCSPENIAEFAYKYADAMMKERAK